MMSKKAIFLALLCCVSAVWTMIICGGICRIVSSNALSMPEIIIDAGHGGFDGGTVSENGVMP